MITHEDEEEAERAIDKVETIPYRDDADALSGDVAAALLILWKHIKELHELLEDRAD